MSNNKAKGPDSEEGNPLDRDWTIRISASAD